MTSFRKGFLLIVALTSCRDLLGIDDFVPPGEHEQPVDLDTLGSGGGTGGGAVETPPKLVWWRAFGGDSDDRITSVVASPSGPVVAGVVDGVMDAGAGPVGQAGVRAFFVLNLDAAGAPGTTLVSEGPGAVDHASMTLAPDGTTVVAASYKNGAITIGDSTLPDPTPAMGLAVAAIEPGGTVRFAMSMTSDALEPLTLTTDKSGAIAVGGKKRGTFTAGAITLTGGLDDDALLVKLTPQGEVIFAHDFRATSDSANQAVWTARFDGNDTLHVAGTFSGDLALGGSSSSSRGARDGFIATLNDAGDASLLAQIGGGGAAVEARALAFTNNGVVMAATAEGDFELGEALIGGGASDIVIAALDDAGNPQWAIRLGGSGPDFVHALEAAEEGGLLVGASFSADFALAAGEAPLTSAGEQDALVFALSDSGGLRWARGFGRHDNDAVYAVALDAAGELLIAGGFREAAALDGQVVHSAGGEDGIVAALAP